MLPKPAALRVSDFLYDYAKSKDVHMKANFVNADHTHAVIDLPTGHSIEEVLKLFKGASSHWINEQKMIRGHFSWGRGYGAFSVSHSNLDIVVRYVLNQEAHHRKKPFGQELAEFVTAYGLEWNDAGEDD